MNSLDILFCGMMLAAIAFLLYNILDEWKEKGIMQLTAKLDAKFYGDVFKVKNDSLVHPDEWMVFLAKDNAFAATLPIYRIMCVTMGADQRQLDSIDRTIVRLNKWREANSEKCHVPGAEGEKLLA